MDNHHANGKSSRKKYGTSWLDLNRPGVPCVLPGRHGNPCRKMIGSPLGRSHAIDGDPAAEAKGDEGGLRGTSVFPMELSKKNVGKAGAYDG